jgi:hypothetical protein
MMGLSSSSSMSQAACLTSAEAQNDKNDESETAKVVVVAGFYEHIDDKDDNKHWEWVFIFILVSLIAIQSLCHHFEVKDGGCKVRDEYHFVKSDAINLVMNIALFTAKL